MAAVLPYGSAAAYLPAMSVVEQPPASVPDFAAPPRGHNALGAMSVAVAGFWDLVLGACQRVSAVMARR